MVVGCVYMREDEGDRGERERDGKMRESRRNKCRNEDGQ